MDFLIRLWHCLGAILLLLDIFLCQLWLILLYPFKLSDRPNGRQSLSFYVGKGSFYKRKWAVLPERIINRIAIIFGDDEDHCLRAYEFLKPIDIYV